jgi:hypothetical protein
MQHHPGPTSSRPTLAYLMDPRFRGGTSSSFAEEIKVTADLARVRVHALSGGRLKGLAPSPTVEAALADTGLDLLWDSQSISADIVVTHNPLFLSTTEEFRTRIAARDLIVVSHENFLRPGGHEAFDVMGVLNRIAGSSFALRRWIAPVSAHNRRTVNDWIARSGTASGWQVLPQDWTNILEGPMLAPTPAPRDRRGRHSRAGLEKFPSAETMAMLFPRHAEANVILGFGPFTQDENRTRHWKLLPFDAVPVQDYLRDIDFMVYFVAPTWRESFCRSVGEAVVAGKMVIADPAMSEIFGDAVVPARPEEVDAIIAHHVAHPLDYCDRVRRAQAALEHWSAAAFRARVLPLFEGSMAAAA